ncbi:hypothetical protein GW17_00015084 [Ensete ventricosum]|nr:hypothetical protein GW17_00015084 [Ensete ventricosum]
MPLLGVLGKDCSVALISEVCCGQADRLRRLGLLRLSWILRLYRVDDSQDERFGPDSAGGGQDVQLKSNWTDGGRDMQLGYNWTDNG